MNAITDILEFLPCETPVQWLDNAVNNIPLLLIDHANCEKKAASSAINLIYRYVDHFDVLEKMSRLAREELRHFEQVISIMKERDIQYQQIEASRYANQLRKEIRSSEPNKLIDTLLVGAIIEARSCERFAKLAPRLDQQLGSFYTSLLRSESRHYRDYLKLAGQISKRSKQKTIQTPSIEERISAFLKIEKELICQPDEIFRFHSGPINSGRQPNNNNQQPNNNNQQPKCSDG